LPAEPSAEVLPTIAPDDLSLPLKVFVPVQMLVPFKRGPFVPDPTPVNPLPSPANTLLEFVSVTAPVARIVPVVTTFELRKKTFVTPPGKSRFVLSVNTG
jgi:hypothetical protein